jgi:DNA polymerase I-like protein with 3'-5' exonuclease and polymerase domains
MLLIVQNQGPQRAEAGDRRTNGADRQASDHEKGLPKPKSSTVRAAIGPIDGFKDTEEGFFRRLNSPVQGTGADGLKLALGLLHERRDERPGAVPILAVHDEIVVECNETEAGGVEVWLKKAMLDGMDGVLNAPDVEGPRVPVEVEVESGRSWAG